ncbi:hypothetical protein KOM00_05590 [Geomonas sp. Red69]|uniref:hypothetical protein n=1 Tax=Geomonas diazotrophica TaxID=2843197 RepID=UPI001C0F92F7|nr:MULTISPECIES: hypothetical protein [Geomonas]MBU5636200.1 hypothetical protein [Geomonas diazotrophica]QXE85164.1 hypothetical protein KP003_12240 [Geomonas nitrogeniifigens]
MDISIKDKTEDIKERQYREFIGFVRGIESNIENLLESRNGTAPLTAEDERSCEAAIETQKIALIEGCRKLKRDQESKHKP